MNETTTFNLRELCAKDVAPVTSILTKIGFKEFKECFQSEEIKQIAKTAEDGKDIAGAVGLTVMFDIVGIILANYAKCQPELFKFLASISDLKEKEIESLPLDEFTELLVQVVKKEEFVGFMKVVSKLFK